MMSRLLKNTRLNHLLYFIKWRSVCGKNVKSLSLKINIKYSQFDDIYPEGTGHIPLSIVVYHLQYPNAL